MEFSFGSVGYFTSFLDAVLLDFRPHVIPDIFLDAMEVRSKIFVEEQGVRAQNELDSDDHCSCYWVLYTTAEGTENRGEANFAENNLLSPLLELYQGNTY